MRERQQAILALGANVAGRAGPAEHTLRQVPRWLEAAGALPVACSGLWRSAPFGLLAQPPFFNAVVVVEEAEAGSISPRRLLRLAAQLERRAGRRRGRLWGPRALDIDLIDVGGAVLRPPHAGHPAGGMAARRAQGKGLILPHPGMAQRAFVLAPLAEAAPGWRHPVSGRTAAQMLAMLPWRVRAHVRRIGEL